MSANTTAYYDATAARYNELQDSDRYPEHVHALERGWRLLQRFSITSVLDVGCGSGKALIWMQDQRQSLRLFGIDPSRGLLQLAKEALPTATLEVGSGEQLPYADNSIDVAVATGIMHHVDNPSAVIAEMFRVARRAVLISDHNNFAFGGTMAQRVRMLLRACGLLRAANFVKQGFRRQGYSEEDGWWYPYSLFDNYADIARRSEEVYLFPTRAVTGMDGNLLFAQSHIAVLAFKNSA